MAESGIREYGQYIRNLKGLSERTLKAYSTDISSWISFLEDQGVLLEEAGRDEARLYISTLSMRQLAASTINRTLSSLKGYYSFLEKRGEVKGNPFTGLRSMKKTCPSACLSDKQRGKSSAGTGGGRGFYGLPGQGTL